MRSKIEQLTKTCDSYHLSHFAAFFIEVGTKTSIAENVEVFVGLSLCCQRSKSVCSWAVLLTKERKNRQLRRWVDRRKSYASLTKRLRSFSYTISIDPSSGSPKDTVLRLHLTHKTSTRINSPLLYERETQILATRAYFVRKMRRAVCTKARDVFFASWWLANTRNSSFKTNNCKNLSQTRLAFTDYPRLSAQEMLLFLKKTAQLVEPISVARVSPRSSKGHHRPVIAPNFHQLVTDSPFKKWYMRWDNNTPPPTI